MKNTSTNHTPGSPSGSKSEGLHKLFIDSLKDIYWAEKALTKALPKMAKKANSPELAKALEKHLTETEEQIKRLERVFGAVKETPRAKKCHGMEGLIKESDEIVSETEGETRDAGIIAAAQKIEHYEIASYGTLRTFAEVLGINEAVSLLEETLEEEKGADEKLTNLAEAGINAEASQEN